jgi:23S rRNA U2552 (ribose-2'-O)-methylase RlmE/FtsJ
MTTYEITEPSPVLSDHQFLRTWSVPHGAHVYPQRDFTELLLKLIYTNEEYQKLHQPLVLSKYKGFLVSFSILDPTNAPLYSLLHKMFLSLPSGPISYSPTDVKKFERKRMNLTLFDHFPTRQEIFHLYQLPLVSLPTRTNFAEQSDIPLPFPIKITKTQKLAVHPTLERVRQVLLVREKVLNELPVARRVQLRTYLQPCPPFEYYGFAGSKLLDIFRQLHLSPTVTSWLDLGSHPGHFARALHALFPDASGDCVSLVSSSPFHALPSSPLINPIFKDLRHFQARHHYDVVTYDAYSDDPLLPKALIPICRQSTPQVLIAKFGHIFDTRQHYIIEDLAHLFKEFHLIKPLQSKPWNSELYFIGLTYQPNQRPLDITNLVLSYANPCYAWNQHFLSNLHLQQPYSYHFQLPNIAEYPEVTPFVKF